MKERLLNFVAIVVLWVIIYFLNAAYWLFAERIAEYPTNDPNYRL